MFQRLRCRNLWAIGAATDPTVARYMLSWFYENPHPSAENSSIGEISALLKNVLSETPPPPYNSWPSPQWKSCPRESLRIPVFFCNLNQIYLSFCIIFQIKLFPNDPWTFIWQATEWYEPCSLALGSEQLSSLGLYVGTINVGCIFQVSAWYALDWFDCSTLND